MVMEKKGRKRRKDFESGMVMEKKGRKRRKGLNDARAYVRKAEEGSKIFP